MSNKRNYSSDEGRWVTINGKHVFIEGDKRGNLIKYHSFSAKNQTAMNNIIHGSLKKQIPNLMRNQKAVLP